MERGKGQRGGNVTERGERSERGEKDGERGKRQREVKRTGRGERERNERVRPLHGKAKGAIGAARERGEAFD